MRNQWLNRGIEIDNKKIGYILNEDENWQILSMSDNYKILLINEVVYNQIMDYSKKSLFIKYNDIYYFITKENYVIASLNYGPYCKKYIDAINFSKVYNECAINNDVYDILYIEELELLIEISNKTFEENLYNKRLLFSSWLTNGVKINLENEFERFEKLTPWFDDLQRNKIVNLAGFDISKKIDIEKIESQNEIKKKEFSLIGRKELESFFKENIIEIIENEEQYSRVGITFPSATILYGQPGCGKTYAVDRLIEYLNIPTYYINSSNIGSALIHETSKKIAELFENAIKNAPSIVVIDEMEAFLSKRNSGDLNQHKYEEMAEFLKLIPLAISKKVLIIGMTNMIDEIDPAILRSGRFDLKFEVKMASALEIEEMIKNKLKELPVDMINYTEIAKKIEGKPLSDVSFVIREACKNTVRFGKEMIDDECFEEAIKILNENSMNKEKRRIGF